MANANRGKISSRTRSKITVRCGHNDCKYASTLSGGMCDYLSMTGKIRGCPANKNCKKYESAKEYKNE